MISFRSADLIDRVKSQSRVLNVFLPKLQMIAPAYTIVVFYEDSNVWNSPIEKIELGYMQFVFKLIRDNGKIIFEIGKFEKIITDPQEVVDLIIHFTENPNLVKTADLIDHIRPRFRWIFDDNKDLDRFITEEDDERISSVGKYTSTTALKSNGTYRRPGWVFVMQYIKSDKSPFTDHEGVSGRKDIFLNGRFMGKVSDITRDGYVEMSIGEKIDPAKVKIVEANHKLIK